MKQFKDPIYGYVEVKSCYIPIINSAEFQRLRNIRQTGYASLYPSALHNRFVHSLGVFHLGKKAIDYLRSNIGNKLGEDFDNVYDWDEIRETFILSCLLHDVGHSPFSHTGEDFYNASTIFEKEFQDLIQSPTFDNDVMDKGTGKPHEAMSAIIGINLLEKMGFNFEKEFFARAIMGIEYSSKEIKYQLRNCLINILNGSLIDVDKLDYLMRDAYVTGYSTMKIDYERLIAGYVITKIKTKTSGEIFKLAFKKGSLSIIENITYANDLERRWIQSNPTVLYDCKLVEHAIIRYNRFMMGKYENLKKYGNVFNKMAISKEGFPKEDNVKLRLLCDDDIIAFLKNDDESIVGEHYFARDMRFKPLWKSEAEYILKVKECIAPKKLENMLDFLRGSLKDFGLFFMNEEELQRLNDEKTKENKEKQDKYTRPIYLVNFFNEFAIENGFDFDFAITRESAFVSNRKKMEENPIYIVFDEKEKTTFMEAMHGKEKSVNTAKDSMHDTQIFYVYTSKKNLQIAKENKQNVANLLIEYINSKWELLD
ncbi:MAG: HD domain-containing protein [Clostridia bacterium]|nr:HD domain-containing protein [Clostridia bacterium]